MATLTRTYPKDDKIFYRISYLSVASENPKPWDMFGTRGGTAPSARSQEPLPHNSQKSLSRVVSMLESV